MEVTTRRQTNGIANPDRLRESKSPTPARRMVIGSQRSASAVNL